jgi:lysophospholipase L1-like esterase
MAEMWTAVAERARRSWNRLCRWAAGFWGAYALLIGGVAVATGASMTRHRGLLAAGFVVLALAASRFHEVVRRQAEEDRERRADRRRRRVVVAMVQLAVGTGVVIWALRGTSWVAEAAFLFGVALAILAVGGLVAELRTAEGPPRVRPWTVVAGGAVVAATALVALAFDGWPVVGVVMVVLVVATVVGDLAARSERTGQVGGDREAGGGDVPVEEGENARPVRWWRRPGVVLLAGAVVALVVGAVVREEWFVGVVLAGVVAGELGTELLSEDSHGWEGRRRWLVLPAGLLLLLVAGGLFVGLDVQPYHALLLLLGLAVIAWMASSAGDSLLLLGLVVLALVWTAVPAGAPPGDGREVHEVEADDRYFLALGDSYISGEGAREFLPGTNTTEDDEDHVNECRRAPTAWPLRLARYRSEELGSLIPARALFLACSGATTGNIHTRPRLEDGEQAGPAELDLFRQRRDGEPGRPETALQREPEFVLVQVGGNDARFGDIGQACVGPGNCAELGQQFLDDLAKIGDDLDAAYRRIKRQVGEDVPIIAVPYPIPLSATRVCDDVLLRGEEHDFVRGFVRQLNHMVRSAARRNGLLYMAPMQDALLRSGTTLCDESGLDAGINFLAFNPKEGALGQRLNPSNWTHNSLHPNADGHQALHRAAVAWFQDHAGLTIPRRYPDDRHDVADLDSVLRGRHVVQCAPADSSSCATRAYAWHLGQVHEAYGPAIVPLAVAMVGAWLALAPLMWEARRRGISLAKAVRATLSPEPGSATR